MIALSDTLGPLSGNGPRRQYLFLQGPNGSFFERLAQRLCEQGQSVHRILFNGGDRIFWRLPGAVDYRGTAADWPAFLNDKFAAWSITDLVLFGDCRPLHRDAIRLAQLRGVRVHVFEEGYLRPNWITLEADGVNGHSSLPRDAIAFHEAARAVAPWSPGREVHSSFAYRACIDVIYTFAMLLLRWCYPGYRTHKPWSPLLEYRSGAPRFLRRSAARKHAERVSRALLAEKRRYFLFSLQLDSDSQIRFHSQDGRMAPAIRRVIESFARHAPADAVLVVTEHPLETGVVDPRVVTLSAARDAGIAERVIYLQGGSPPELVPHSCGLVTVNSTMGIVALDAGIPLIALGQAIYDLPGLSFQDGLNRFWHESAVPDAALFDAFRRVLVARTQINGGFYSRQALELAVDHAVQRLEQSASEHLAICVGPTPASKVVLQRIASPSIANGNTLSDLP